MKKVFTWFSSLALALAFVFSSSLTSFAKEPQSPQENSNPEPSSTALNQKLKNMGMPDSIIQEMAFKQKQHVLKRNAQYLGSTVSDYDANGNLSCKLNTIIKAIKPSKTLILVIRDKCVL